MMNHRFIFVLLMLLLSTINAYAQKSYKGKILTIVQYRDGSVFVGKINNAKALTLNMVLTTGDTIHLRRAEIKKIRHTDKDILLFAGAKYHHTKGVFYNIQVGVGLGEVENETAQLDLVAGYRFNKNWAAGIGIGSSYNATFSFGTLIEANAVPIFIYGRYYLPFNTKIRPFVAGKMGWSFPNQDAFNGDHQGGALFQPEIGVNFASRKKVRIILAIGQQLQNIRGDILDFDPFGNRIQSKFNLWFNRTILKLGIEWK